MMIKTISVFLLCALLFACSTSSLEPVAPENAPVPTAAYPYDGSWKGELITQQGSCRKRYAFKELTVRVSKVSGYFRGVQGKYNLEGEVEADGASKMTAIGGTTVKLLGQFDQSSAEGSWNTQSGCTGKFKFERLQ